MQQSIAINGHAIEARVYAEDPQRGFLPSIGRIAHWRMPRETSRVRVDTGVREGDGVTPYYDPMLAKVIAWGEDRERARSQLAAALPKFAVNSVCPGWVRTDMGGPTAPRSVEEGADTAVWLATDAPPELTGKFFRDRQEIPW